ncbi:MAG: hypothetical protein R3E97_16990 [Candidatus Eisenbacteria bacterium]
MRTVAAVLVPWIVWGLLDTVIYMAVSSLYPDSFGVDGEPLTRIMLLLFLVLRAGYSLIAGWIVGRMAGLDNTACRATVVLLLLTGVVAQVVNRGMYPLWYHVVFVLSIVPCLKLGMRLGARPGSELDPHTSAA